MMLQYEYNPGEKVKPLILRKTLDILRSGLFLPEEEGTAAEVVSKCSPVWIDRELMTLLLFD